MKFRFLSEQLHPIAEAAIRFFKDNWGVGKFFAEEAIDDRIERRPTLYGQMHDHHYLCLEVSESPYPTGLDSFVLDCMRLGVPVRLFVVIPEGSGDANFERNLDRARGIGVGVLEASVSNARILHEPLSLSLVGVRHIEKKKFPPKYRYALSQAESTFRNGNPAKGCALLYDEIEALTRRIVKRTHRLGWWRPLKPGEKTPKVNFDTGPWERVVSTLMGHLDYQKCKIIKRDLLGRILGITSHRNDAAHKPKTRSALIKRDRESRTRFENAADILLELIQASKPLRV